MNVVEDLLQPKFPPRKHGIDPKAWESCQTQLIDALLRRNGLHRDELNNYNAYVDQVILLVKQHLKLKYVDMFDQLHVVKVLHAHYVLPYESKVGIDTPERALMRNHYECQIHGVVRYTIYRQPNQVEPDAEPTNPSRDKRLRTSPTGDVEDNDEEEEDEEEEEEDEDENVISSEDEDEASDEDADSLSDEEGELIPEVKGSRHTEKAKKPAFFIDMDQYKNYTEIVHQADECHHLMNLPPWIRSKLCWLSTPFRDPTLMPRPYLRGCNYMVSRNFKLCPYEETYVNNRILSISGNPNTVEIRSTFYQASKRFRTNCTHRFAINQSHVRSKQWQKLPRFQFEIPHENRWCSIMVLAMAYGWTQADFVASVRMFLRQEHSPQIETYLQVMALDTDGCTNQLDALRRMSSFLSGCKKKTDPDAVLSLVAFTLRVEYFHNLIDHARNNNDNEGHELDNLRKGLALAEVVAELIQLSDLVNADRELHLRRQRHDKRDYALKRLDSPGEKIAFLCRKYLALASKKGSSNLKKAVDNRQNIDLTKILNQKTIKITASVKNGIWDSKTDTTDHNQNKTQMMITGFCSDDFHMQVQKIVKTTVAKNNDSTPLLTHPSQTGRVDIYLTPESERCGIVRNKALGCYLSPLINLPNLQALITRVLTRNASVIGWLPLTLDKVFPSVDYTAVKDVFGGVIGWVRYPFKLYQLFVGYRRRGAIWSMLGLEWDRVRHVFNFYGDEGRLLRPLVVLDKLKELIRMTNSYEFMHVSDPVQYLIRHGALEYLDATEEYCGTVLVADSLEATIRAGFIHTHMEIHGLFALSITVAKAFCNYNQGPRRMYTGNMEKRSIGLKIFPDRGTSVTYSLWYGQDPLMSDPVDQSLGLRHNEPNGINVLIAVISDRNTIEDCYVFKKEAIERGMGVSCETMVHVSGLGQHYSFAKPTRDTKGCASRDKYAHLNADGTPKLRERVTGGAAMIGRVFERKGVTRCVSKFMPWNMEYRVSAVDRYPTQLNQPAKIVRAMFSKVNHPGEGDKFYMAHGQKGTGSDIRPAVDMPFFEYGPMAGQAPDMLTNVHSLARITLGLTLEILWGKARACNPVAISQYQTMFLSTSSFEERQALCRKVLAENGMASNGRERMRWGTTGQEIECEIFSGMVYLRVLKHMAKDKLRARERGPNNEITRQTSVGKKKSGGQRQGEMMNWNMYCYGMPGMLRNINHESADKFLMYFCTKCHTQAVGCQDTGYYMCLVCKTPKHVGRLPNTYITNLVFQELNTAGFGHTIVTEVAEQDLDAIDEEVVFDGTQNLLADEF